MRRKIAFLSVAFLLLLVSVSYSGNVKEPTPNAVYPKSGCSKNTYKDDMPVSPNVICKEADEFLRQRQVGKALAAMNKCISKNPKSPFLYMERGNIWAMKGDWQEAIKDFTKVIQLRPNYFRAYEFRGLAKFKAGKISEAMEDLDHALALNPGSSQLLTRKGNILVSLGRFKEAVDVFTEVIKLSPKFFAGYVNRANVYETLGEYALALKDYNRAIDLESRFPPLYFSRGLIRFYEGEFKNAVKDFEVAYKKNKKNEQIGIMLALAYARRGNKKKANKIFEDLAKTVTGPNKAIADLFLKKILPSNFLKLVQEKSMALSTYNGFLGEYYLLTNNLEAAKKAFERCISLDASCRNIPCRFSKAELNRLRKRLKKGP